jgi:hypothetical protein
MTAFIGVDPAFRNNGFYVCSIIEQKVEFIPIKTFIDFVSFVDALHESGVEIYMCIENSNETNYTFVSPKLKKASLREKVSRDVGKNQAVSQMSVDYAKHRIKYGYIYSVSPAQKGMKWSDFETRNTMISLNHEVLNYKGINSEQDKRDAYKLALRAVYERNITLQKKKIEKK